MHPALTQIQQTVRAAELHERAERDRRQRMPRRRTVNAEPEQAAARERRAPLFGPIFGTHGYFGREHGSHV